MFSQTSNGLDTMCRVLARRWGNNMEATCCRQRLYTLETKVIASFNRCKSLLQGHDAPCASQISYYARVFEKL